MLARRPVLEAAAACGALAVFGRGMAADISTSLQHPESGAESPAARLRGRILYFGEEGYEARRTAAVWNGRKPRRFPSAIVMAESDSDVIDGVKLAKGRGWKVAARSGGHSWTASHTRNKTLLIDLAKTRDISIDAHKSLAIVSPAWQGQALNTILREEHGLMFPSGHCHGVGLGGFVMCGGHGWNSRQWGPACANLQALDVVTADGRLIHADETENSDYLWAARGGGPGFFGVAVRYYLKLHKLPRVMKLSLYIYPVEVVDALLNWIGSVQNTLPKYIEASVIAGQDETGRQVLRLNGAVFANTDAEADEALAILDGCPVLDKAISRHVRVPAIFPAPDETAHELNPRGARYVVDGSWTNAPAREIIPAIREFLVSQPTPHSYFLWFCWGPVQSLANMAYSLQGDTYLSPCGVSFDAADDWRCADWVARAVAAMKPFSLGGQMNDENMVAGYQAYLSQDAARRLAALRAKHDPEGVFAGFLTSADG